MVEAIDSIGSTDAATEAAGHTRVGCVRVNAVTVRRRGAECRCGL